MHNIETFNIFKHLFLIFLISFLLLNNRLFDNRIILLMFNFYPILQKIKNTLCIINHKATCSPSSSVLIGFWRYIISLRNFTSFRNIKFGAPKYCLLWQPGHFGDRSARGNDVPRKVALLSM